MVSVPLKITELAGQGSGNFFVSNKIDRILVPDHGIERKKFWNITPVDLGGRGAKNRLFRIDSDLDKTDTNRFPDPDLNTKVPKTTVGDLRNPYLDQENCFLTLKISQKMLYVLNYNVVHSNFLHKHRSKQAWYIESKTKKIWGPP